MLTKEQFVALVNLIASDECNEAKLAEWINENVPDYEVGGQTIVMLAGFTLDVMHDVGEGYIALRPKALAAKRALQDLERVFGAMAQHVDKQAQVDAGAAILTPLLDHPAMEDDYLDALIITAATILRQVLNLHAEKQELGA